MSRFDDKPVGGDESGKPYLVHAAPGVDPIYGLGALFGLAVGDALGTTLEFERRPAIPFTPPLDGPHREVTGGGPFGVAAGQVTDDTQMATALTVSLMECGGFRADKVGTSYLAWSRSAFDIGNQTRDALSRVARGTAALDAGRETWLAGGKKAAGNGSLMRTAPIALFYQDDAARCREVAMQDSAITHFDPRCQLACAAFDAAIAAAVGRREDEPRHDAPALVEVARTALGEARDAFVAAHPAFANEAHDAHAGLAADLDRALMPDPDLYGSNVNLATMAGYVRVAFRLAFWQLVHAASYEAGLIDTVNRGADADTNGAIVGALLGAYHGLDAIPVRWRETVVGALAGDNGPWATIYHPSRMFALVRT